VIRKESIGNFLTGNRFHVTLRILSPENCKQCLRGQNNSRASKQLKIKVNNSIYKLRQLKLIIKTSCIHWKFKSNWR